MNALIEAGALGCGIYGATLASKLANLARPEGAARIGPRRIRGWFDGSAHPRSPCFCPGIETSGRHRLISFVDLVDVIGATRLIWRGFSGTKIRRWHDRLVQVLSDPHPFARHEFHTDGKSLFLRTLQASGEAELLDLDRMQFAFDSIVLPFLDQIEYDRETSLASRWNVAAGVVVDPAIRFGRPVAVGTRIPTYILAETLKAENGDAERVAEWYELTADQVRAAAAFEDQLRAA